jgi:hypothetical protein
MSETKTYEGSCHCGEVRFRVTADIEKASTCNCSICSRVGWRMKSVPRESFELLAGHGAQTDYQFGARTMHHLFCARCGIHAYGTYGSGAEEKVIVNLHCLDGLDASALPVEHFDGKSF